MIEATFSFIESERREKKWKEKNEEKRKGKRNKDSLCSLGIREPLKKLKKK